MDFQAQIQQGIPNEIPSMPPEEVVGRAPKRELKLNDVESKLALKNALRYFPSSMHAELAPEFAEELRTRGRIYMYRFRPTYEMKARPIDEYPAKCVQAAAMMHMIQNNLDKRVAQHPYELITYGGTGTVFQNWAQYLLTMKYLSEMTDEQTLVMYSGHPMGLFPSSLNAPRAVITNGMVVPNYSSEDDYNKMAAQGVTMYGQMTAGSWMYIGPQGIVHGTMITLLNAGRLYLGLGAEQGLAGKLFVTSGLGGMSGAQAKASVIAGAVGVIAEINQTAINKRLEQGWLDEAESDLDKLIERIRQAVEQKQAVSIGYSGNIVDLWEKLAESNIKVDLGSDQTSLHAPFSGGYYPAGLSYDEANQMMTSDTEGFKQMVRESLKRQVRAIDIMVNRGMHFWDYGNAFLVQAKDAGADILKSDSSFKYPSYVEDIMGPMCFDYGFGPFRWVCTSGREEDLRKTDQIAIKIFQQMLEEVPLEIKQQIADNLRWISQAEQNKLVVGSQARILYSNSEGRIKLAKAFNSAIASGEISAPIVIGRDHHDVSGTDSPFRETANIHDGSMFTADMAIQNVIGDSFRGATWVSIHNGGGVGWGRVINGGFGLVLDGTSGALARLEKMIPWDVLNGIARRAWAGNTGAKFALHQAASQNEFLQVTERNEVDPVLLDAICK